MHRKHDILGSRLQSYQLFMHTSSNARNWQCLRDLGIKIDNVELLQASGEDPIRTINVQAARLNVSEDSIGVMCKSKPPFSVYAIARPYRYRLLFMIVDVVFTQKFVNLNS